MQFETAFDITTASYAWHYPAIGLPFLVIATVWSLYDWYHPKSLKRWMPRLCACFCAFWSILVFCTTFPEWLAGRRALRDHTAAVVEGPVEDFVPMPFEGHADESFTVRGVRFFYSDYNMSSTFNNTSSHGGPVRAARYVRVHYVGNAILKLELARVPQRARLPADPASGARSQAP
jgi:hypothetical protein